MGNVFERKTKNKYILPHFNHPTTHSVGQWPSHFLKKSQKVTTLMSITSSDMQDLTKAPEMVSESVSNPLSIEDELNSVIKEEQSLMQPVRYETFLSKVQKEMTLFENGSTRNDYVKIYYLFMTLKMKILTA